MSATVAHSILDWLNPFSPPNVITYLLIPLAISVAWAIIVGTVLGIQAIIHKVRKDA